MNPDSPLAAFQAIPQELRETREELRKLHEQLEAERRERQEEVRKERRRRQGITTVLTAVVAALALALGIVTYRGERHNSDNTAAISQVAEQNSDLIQADAQRSRVLCLRLNKTRTEIVAVWRQVQFVRGADRQALEARIKAAEPLGKCA